MPEEKSKLYVRVEPMVNPTKSSDPKLNSLVYVNDDTHPVVLNNEHFTGHLVFRVRNFRGWTPIDSKTGKELPPISDCPDYFAGHKRSFSLQISGRFRKQWTGDDIMFGTFFKQKLALPRFSNIALRFAQKIDPSMEWEADTDTPYICSPILCAMNTVNIQPLLAPVDAGLRRSLEGQHNLRSSLLYATAVKSQSDTTDSPLTLPEWTFHGKHEMLQENLMSAWPCWTTTANGVLYTGSTSDPNRNSLVKTVAKKKTDAAHRRAWFLDPKHRKRFIFHPDTVYSFDFASPYVDMNEIMLKMGINIHVAPYLGGQPVRYECRTRSGSVLFWALELGLK